MNNRYIFKRSGLLQILILLVMTTSASSQDIPDYDKISTSNGFVEMHFLGHGSLMFKVNGTAVFVDPVKGFGDYELLPKADIILITHEHGDHLDAKLIEEIKKEGTLVFCNANSTKTITWALAMEAGDRQEINDIIIEAVPAYNIVNERAPGQPFHPKGGGLGYVLGYGGKRIYIAGDTENIPEMKALKNIDVAFLPMNLPYTMTPEMVADAAIAFKPKILYPYHFGNTDTNQLIKLLSNTDITVRIRKLN